MPVIELEPPWRRLMPRAWAAGLCAGLSVLGILLVLFGWLSARQASGASETPVPTDLAQLEAGQPLPNIHVRMGPHLRVQPFSFFWLERGIPIGSKPGPDAAIKYAYVPLVSPQHPFARELQALATTHGGIERVRPAEFPQLKDVVVLLRTTRFATVGEIPGYVETADSVHGLFITRVAGLGDVEKKLISENLPGVDPDKLMILMEDKYPTSAWVSWLLAIGGAALILFGVALVVFTKGPLNSRVVSPYGRAASRATSPDSI